MEGQKKGDCGHIMASVDPHGICVRCRECDLVNAPCSVCVAMTSVQREAALLACARRRRRLQRRKQRAGSVCSSSSKQSSGSVDRPTPEPPVTGRGGTEAAPGKGGGSKTAVSRPRPADGSAVDSAPTSVAAASHSGAAAPTRGGSSHAVECDIPDRECRSDDVTDRPRRIESPPSRNSSCRMRAWTRTAWTQIGVAGWSPTENGSIAGGDPHLVASCVVRAPVRVRDPVGTSAGVRDPYPVRDPCPVRDPVRTSRGVRAPTRASVDDRSRSRLRDHHSSSSRSSDSDEGRRTFQQRGERRRRRSRSPRAASAEHPLATVCNKLLQSMGALRGRAATRLAPAWHGADEFGGASSAHWWHVGCVDDLG